MEWKVDTHIAFARRPTRAVDPLAHLGRGLVGERDGEDLPGVRAVGELPGDAVGEHPGLARAGAGDDEQRRAGVHHGLALLRVHALEQCLRLLAAPIGPRAGLLRASGVGAPRVGRCGVGAPSVRARRLRAARPGAAQRGGAGGAREAGRQPGRRAGPRRAGPGPPGRPGVSATHRLVTLPAAPDGPGPVRTDFPGPPSRGAPRIPDRPGRCVGCPSAVRGRVVACGAVRRYPPGRAGDEAIFRTGTGSRCPWSPGAESPPTTRPGVRGPRGVLVPGSGRLRPSRRTTAVTDTPTSTDTPTGTAAPEPAGAHARHRGRDPGPAGRDRRHRRRAPAPGQAPHRDLASGSGSPG